MNYWRWARAKVDKRANTTECMRRFRHKVIMACNRMNDHGVQKFPGSIWENCRVQSSDNQCTAEVNRRPKVAVAGFWLLQESNLLRNGWQHTTLRNSCRRIVLQRIYTCRCIHGKWYYVHINLRKGFGSCLHIFDKLRDDNSKKWTYVYSEVNFYALFL